MKLEIGFRSNRQIETKLQHQKRHRLYHCWPRIGRFCIGLALGVARKAYYGI